MLENCSDSLVLLFPCPVVPVVLPKRKHYKIRNKFIVQQYGTNQPDFALQLVADHLLATG